MGSYRLLFGVAVEHDFFSNGLCQALNFVPTPGTDAAIEKAGLLIRQTVNGIRIFYDDGKTERLQICAADPDVPLTLSFKVDSEDPFFYNYTEPIIYRRDAVLFFDNHATEGEPSGKLRLHSEAFAAQADLVSETDLTDLTVEAGSEPNDEAGIASVIRDVLKDRERVLWPAFIVSIQIPPKDGTLFDAQSEVISQDYLLRFKPRQTFWKYYLVGDMAREDAYIVDMDKGVEFEAGGRESLANNSVALTFRSKTTIPLRERFDYRFQLKEGNSGNGKILIRLLPVARANQINREVIGGEEVAVSEMFINC